MINVSICDGLSGTRIAWDRVGLGQAEWHVFETDKYASAVSEYNYPDMTRHGDARNYTKLIGKDIFLLVAGFPCQPFSQAGHKKGFKDNKDGNLFFSIEQIIKIKKPKAFFLENVRHLKNHDQGRTFKTIYKTLQNLNYTFDYKVIKASDFGLPQHRPRIYMVGFYKPALKNMFKELSFTFPREITLKKTVSDIFGGFVSTDLAGKKERKVGFTLRVGGGRSPINDRRNWDGYIVNKKVVRINSEQGRQMMGFPKTFKMPVSENQAMKQLGNSVAVNVVKAIGKEIEYHLKNYSK